MIRRSTDGFTMEEVLNRLHSLCESDLPKGMLQYLTDVGEYESFDTLPTKKGDIFWLVFTQTTFDTAEYKTPIFCAISCHRLKDSTAPYATGNESAILSGVHISKKFIFQRYTVEGMSPYLWRPLLPEHVEYAINPTSLNGEDDG